MGTTSIYTYIIYILLYTVSSSTAFKISDQKYHFFVQEVQVVSRNSSQDLATIESNEDVAEFATTLRLVGGERDETLKILAHFMNA